jgi:hypothetical protein
MIVIKWMSMKGIEFTFIGKCIIEKIYLFGSKFAIVLFNHFFSFGLRIFNTVKAS